MTAQLFDFEVELRKRALARRTISRLKRLLSDEASQGEMAAVLDRYAADLAGRQAKTGPHHPTDGASR